VDGFELESGLNTPFFLLSPLPHPPVAIIDSYINNVLTKPVIPADGKWVSIVCYTGFPLKTCGNDTWDKIGHFLYIYQ